MTPALLWSLFASPSVVSMSVHRHSTGRITAMVQVRTDADVDAAAIDLVSCAAVSEASIVETPVTAVHQVSADQPPIEWRRCVVTLGDVEATVYGPMRHVKQEAA